MSESFSKVEFMSSLPRNNWWTERTNANPTGLTTEQIELGTYGMAYIPELIKRKRERYASPIDRYEVMCSDEIAIFICERYIEEITEKQFKSYDLDEEGKPSEIMADLWQRIEQLNINEIYQAIYKKWAGDGYALTDLYVTPVGTPGYNVYGYFESPPDYWKRYNMPLNKFHNVIYEYYTQFIPIPNGYQYMGNYNIHAVEKKLYPTQPGFFHFYRKTWNDGVGRPRLQGIWAAATKLRKMSYADYRRALVFNIFEYPEDWDAEKGLEEMIEAVRRADEVEGVAVPMRINPIDQTVEEFPRFRERTWDEQGGAPRSDPSAGGSLLRHSEYARVLIALGYTETKLVGSQPGEVTGSKLDLTRDDQVDLREFKLFTPVIKQINLWLLQNGFLEGLEEDTLEKVFTMDYEIKCWVEWEVMENMMMQQEMAEKDAEMKGQQQTQQSRMNSIVKYNNSITFDVLSAIRFNMNMPMTPVMSSWISQIGVGGTNLYMTTHQGKSYMKPKSDALQQYFSWAESSSKGGYWWDELADPTAARWTPTAIPSELQTGYGAGFSPVAEQQYKMEGEQGLLGAGTTREPFRVQPQLPMNITGQLPGDINYQLSPTQIDYDWNYKYNPSSITGSTRTGPGARRKPGKSKTRAAITPVNIIETIPSSYVPEIRNMSFKTANSMIAEHMGEGFSKSTWMKFKHFLEAWEDTRQFRMNSVDIGNPMNFEIPLKYAANNKKGYVEEYVCPKEWKKLNSHKGELYLYPDLGHGGKAVVVGTYQYSWNEEKNLPEIVRNIDDTKLKSTLEKWQRTNSVIYDRLEKGMPQRMSTEYYCSIMKHNNKRYQVSFHNGHGEPYLKGIAIVEYGNCQEPFCNFEKIKEVN